VILVSFYLLYVRIMRGLVSLLEVAVTDVADNLGPEDEENGDRMEGLETGNMHPNAEAQNHIGDESRGEEGQVKGKRSKSKAKTKKARKSHKKNTENKGADEAEENTLTMDKSDGAANDDLDNHVENEAMLGDLPEPKLAKKSKAKAPKKKKKASKLAAVAENEEHIRDEEEGESIPDLAQLPAKMKRAKRAKAQRTVDGSATRSEEDGDSFDKLLHQPLTPAHVSHHSMGIAGEHNLSSSSRLKTEAASAASGDGQEEEIQRPSEKALGKRKAVDEPAKQGPKKKPKKTSYTGAHGQDLRQMLRSQPPSNEASGVQVVTGNTNPGASPLKQISDRSEKSSVDGPPGGDTQDDHDGSENQAGRDTPKNLSRLPFEAAVLKASETRKRRKRRLLVDEDESGPSSTLKKTKQLKSEASLAKIRKTPEAKVKTTGTSPTKGPLTVGDTTAISDAIESYREFNDMSQYQINELIQQPAVSDSSKDLWKCVFDEIPPLPRRNVIDYCRRNFHNFEGRGVWTAEQDEELRYAYEKNPNKWKTIGQEINRFPEDARDRWRNYLVCAGSMKKDVWDKDEETQLRAAVEECIHAIREERRQTGAIHANLEEDDRLIDWQKVSEKMNHTRSRLQCSYKWKWLKAINESDDEEDPGAIPSISESWRLEDATVQARIFSARERLRLLRALRDSGASKEGKIPWRRISLDLDEMGKRMAWKVCFRELKRKLPGSKKMKFKEVVEHLIDIFERSAPDDPDGFRFDLGPIVSPKKERKSRARRKAKDNESVASDNDNGEGPSTVTKTMSSKKRSKSMPKLKGKGKRNEDDALDANNGEGPSTPASEKRKVRDRMRRQDESTPETTDAVDSSAEDGVAVDAAEDMVGSLQSLKAGKGKKRARNARKSTNFLSEEKVVEDSSDDEGITNGENSKADIATGQSQADIAVKLEVVDGETLDTESVDLDDHHAATAHGFDDNESVDLDEDHTMTANGFELDRGSDLDEDDAAGIRSFNDTGSIDLDEDHTMTANGFENDGLDEDDAASAMSSDNSESTDPDIHDKTVPMRMYSLSPYRKLAGQHIDAFFNNPEADDFGSASSDNDSISSIPARAVRKVSIEL
jgi:hypothetical protein